MAEKKILSVGVRMPEEMVLTLKRLAEAEGTTESQLVRMAVSLLLDERRRQYSLLHSIFGESSKEEKLNSDQPCSTSYEVDLP